MSEDVSAETIVPYKIVVVDDSPFIREITRHCLADEKHTIIEAENGTIAREIIRLERPDLIILDLELPDIHGLDLCTEIRADSRFRFTPIIILTSSYKLEQIVEGYQRGADDYITKDPFNATEFELRVKARVQRTSKLRDEAILDALTGCYSRKALFERLEEELYRHHRYKQVFSLMICDLDDFKQINDNFGHIAGDMALREFASFLRLTFRRSEFVARYGGDEFVILMPGTDIEAAKKSVLRSRQLWNDKTLVIPRDNKQLIITFSSGLTMVGKNDSANTIMDRADQNLYTAKRNGKNLIYAGDGGII